MIRGDNGAVGGHRLRERDAESFESSIGADEPGAESRGHAWRNIYRYLGVLAFVDDDIRITDLSGIEPENFKFRNTRFLTDEDHPYAPGAAESDAELRRKNWNTRNGDIRRVLDDFLTDEPLIEQCALWMHAVVG